MKAVILAAGYATRLYPLTRDFPKPLLEVGGRTILDHLLTQLSEVDEIDQVILVSNHRFIDHFEHWRAGASYRFPIEIIDDGSTENENRHGAVRDLALAVSSRKIAEDVLVAAADNILLFDLKRFVRAFNENGTSTVCVREVPDLAARKRTGIAVIDEAERITEFAEKPEEPQSHWGVPPLYLYPARVLSLVDLYLRSGGADDAPGNFLAWLVPREEVRAHRIEAAVLDIGNGDSLAEARKYFLELQSGGSRP